LPDLLVDVVVVLCVCVYVCAHVHVFLNVGSGHDFLTVGMVGGENRGVMAVSIGELGLYVLFGVCI
jgi:hypothetical protein